MTPHPVPVQASGCPLLYQVALNTLGCPWLLKWTTFSPVSQGEESL